LYKCTIILLVQMYKETSMGKQLPKLSPAETEILRILWQLRTGTVQDVCQTLPAKRRIAYATVQTLLRRLEKKGYIEHELRGRAHVFRPGVKREDVIKRTVGDFVDRLFGGDPLPLMLHLADHSELDADEIKRLKELIDKDSS
jgi:BlaI family penicillinase repressor